jgi:TolB-like protein
LKNNHLLYQTTLAIFICFCVLTGGLQTVTAKERIKTISVLPFHINASEDLTHVKEGIFHMLYSRLSWRDNVVVVPANKIKGYLSHIDNLSGTGGIGEIARLSHSDFVLAGTVTKLGGSFSIDVQVYDIKNKRYLTFFEQSPKSDDLIKKVNRIAAFINKKIFDRTTRNWEKIEQEKQAYIKEQKRKNPEYMMKNPEWQDTEKSPGWKIWKYLF